MSIELPLKTIGMCSASAEISSSRSTSGGINYLSTPAIALSSPVKTHSLAVAEEETDSAAHCSYCSCCSCCWCCWYCSCVLGGVLVSGD